MSASARAPPFAPRSRLPPPSKKALSSRFVLTPATATKAKNSGRRHETLTTTLASNPPALGSQLPERRLRGDARSGWDGHRGDLCGQPAERQRPQSLFDRPAGLPENRARGRQARAASVGHLSFAPGCCGATLTI